MAFLGLASYTIFQRTKEIGIRKVLGASVASLIKLLSSDFIKLIVIAFVIAGPVSWIAMSHWLHAFAYRIHPGWQIFAIAGTLAVLITFLTISFRALHAALANPVTGLRSE